MKKFKVHTTFTFSGDFYIKAEDKSQACEYVENDCGLCIGRDIHTTLSDDIVDWDFSVHPKKEICYCEEED